LAIENLRSHKSPRIDQNPAELIKAGGRPICSEIHKLVTSIWNKKKLPRVDIIPIYKEVDKTDHSNFWGISLLPTTYKILSNILLLRLCRGNYWGSSMWILTQ
jgi:hypothetical protein